MKITINDNSIHLTQPISLYMLIDRYYSMTPGIALAVNQIIVPRKQWTEYLIKDGDSVLLFQAIAGG